MQTATRGNSGAIAEIDIDGPLGTITLPARHGQVVPEGSSRKPMVSKIVDAAEEARKSAMKGFFRIACAEGLDCKNAESMRRELSIALGRPVYSRRDISTGEWFNLQAMVEIGRLCW